MALEINYSPLFIEDLETILTYFDERNGSTGFSRRNTEDDSSSDKDFKIDARDWALD